MNTKLYVENLTSATTESNLLDLFSAYGNVVGVGLLKDGADERPSGFGFVTMVTPEGARAAYKLSMAKQLVPASSPSAKLGRTRSKLACPAEAAAPATFSSSARSQTRGLNELKEPIRNEPRNSAGPHDQFHRPTTAKVF